VALQEGDLVKSEEFVRQALEYLTKTPFPFNDMAYWPLITITLQRDQLDQAIELGRKIVNPPTHRIAPEIEDDLQQAIKCYEAGQRETARRVLNQAMQLAIDTGYF
jgi:hypothetical protein